MASLGWKNSAYFADDMCGISELLQILWKYGFIHWKSIRLGRQNHALLEPYNENGLMYVLPGNVM